MFVNEAWLPLYYDSLTTDPWPVFFYCIVIVIESLESISHGLPQVHEAVCVLVCLVEVTAFGKACS